MTAAPPETPRLRTARVRLSGTIVLLVLAALLALDFADELPLQTAWFDALQRLAPRSIESTPVTIVEIDDKSLAALGPWPWPRTTLAQLVHQINAYSPGAIGIDIVMPEPDPLSPERALAHFMTDAVLLERLSTMPSNDSELAGAFLAAPTVVVLAGLVNKTSESLHMSPIFVRDLSGQRDSVTRAMSHLTQFPGALSSLATLNEAASGWGLISIHDAQGTIRRVPLVASVNGTLAPAFALEMWRVGLRTQALRLVTAGGAAQRVEAGDQSFPVEADGSVRVYFSRHRPARFVSAVDVLSGSVGADRLHRSFVLIGVSATALGDQFWTPVRDRRVPGVEIHAQLLENMSDEAFLSRPDFAPLVEAAILLVIGATLVWATPRSSVRSAALIAVVCAVGLIVAAYAAFVSHRLLFDAVTPIAAMALLFATLLALTLADATRSRKALQQVVQRQREESARVAGELQAARRIQLDTLPRAESLQDPRVDLAATMEPAQEVGGDLYDFYLLDERRLYFMLGDVAGKGLSASIFMAVSKALCKSTTLRARDADLGALLRQTNREVERDNPASLFVTVFAGVLDLDTGELRYCNAGHENPWLVSGGGGTITRLAAGGGPPLCALDDFPYQSAQTQMQPDDLLCVVSDGVTEACDPAKSLYGTARLERMLRHVDSAQSAVDALRADVLAFAAGAEAADDMTVLALRWRGPVARAA